MLINIGLPGPDYSRLCSMNALNIRQRAFYGNYLVPLDHVTASFLIVPTCLITRNNAPMHYTLNKHTCENVALRLPLYS